MPHRSKGGLIHEIFWYLNEEEMRTVDVPQGIRIQHLSNTTLEHYHYDNPLSQKYVEKVKKHTTFTFSLNNQKKPPKMI
jgi:hypothetical protein